MNKGDLEKRGDAFMRILEISGEIASPEEIKRRNQLIPFLESLSASWVKSVYVERKLDEFTVNQANARVMPYGSFALGVSSISSDIDLLCIVPGEVNEKDFFSSFYALLSHNSRITELKAIPLAFVPIITMEIDGVSVDISFASLPSYPFKLPENLDILSNDILRNVSEHTLHSLTGCRCTEFVMQKLRSEDKLDIFRQTFFGIRFFTKQYKIYKNAMGYLGGVNITILLAATNLLENNDFLTNTFHFFHFVANHLGSEIIAMTPQLSFPELGFDDENWSDKPSSISNHDCLVLLTPTYPRMNTARTISRSSLQFIRSQSRLVCEKIGRYVDGESTLLEMVEPYQFFEGFPIYFEVLVSASVDSEFRDWLGLVESKIRYLVFFMSLRIENVALNPNPIVSKSNSNAACFYIGLTVDLSKATTLDLSQCVNDFIDIVRIQQPKTARLGLRIRYREELKELKEAIPKSWEEFAEKAEFCDILEE